MLFIHRPDLVIRPTFVEPPVDIVILLSSCFFPRTAALCCLKGASALSVAYSLRGRLRRPSSPENSLRLAAANAPSSQLPRGVSYGRYRALANRPCGRCPAGPKEESPAFLLHSRSESAARLTGKAAAASRAASEGGAALSVAYSLRHAAAAARQLPQEGA